VAKAQRSSAEVLLSEMGLHVGQDAILLALWAENGITQSDLVASCNCGAPTVTRTLSRMERAGVLERRRDVADGRVSRVYLTRRGRGLQAKVLGSWAVLEQRTFAGLDAEGRRTLRRLLSQVLANLSGSDAANGSCTAGALPSRVLERNKISP
jgi:DNA-binding MarR family transcriptional regulator